MSSLQKYDLADKQAEARLTVPTQVKPSEKVCTMTHMRRDPVVLEGLFLEVIRTFYSLEDNLLPHTKLWDPTGKTKGSPTIDIDSTWEDSTNNPYPIVVVAIENLKYSTEGVEGIGANLGYNLKEAIEYHARVVTGAVTFKHISTSKSQALAYQATTLDNVDGFSSVIRKELCFEFFKVTDIFKPRQRKDQPLEWEANIQAQFRFQETFSNKQESPKLKQVSVKLNAGINQRFNMVE